MRQVRKTKIEHKIITKSLHVIENYDSLYAFYPTQTIQI